MKKVSKSTLGAGAVLVLAAVFALATVPAAAIYNPNDDGTLPDDPAIRTLMDDGFEGAVPTNDDIVPISDEVDMEEGEPAIPTGDNEQNELARTDDEDEGMDVMVWVMIGGGVVLVGLIAAVVVMRMKKKN